MSRPPNLTKLSKEKTTTEARPYKRTFLGKDLTPVNIYATKMHSTMEDRQRDYIKDR